MKTAVTVLTTSQGQRATKQLDLENDQIVKRQMQMAKRFFVDRAEIETIYELGQLVAWLSEQPDKFVIRGEPIDDLDPSRPHRRLKYPDVDSPATFRSTPQGERWLCLDFDRIKCPATINPLERPGDAVAFLVSLLPSVFYDVTCFAQWSSSSGIDQWKTLSAHLWFMLDRPMHDDQLYDWAKTSRAPIDARLFNTVQPHFTAAPILSTGVIDPCPVRCGLVRGLSDIVQLNIGGNFDAGSPEIHSRATGVDAKATRQAA